MVPVFRKDCDVVRVTKEPYVAAVYLVPMPARLLSVREGEVDDDDPEDGDRGSPCGVPLSSANSDTESPKEYAVRMTRL